MSPKPPIPFPSQELNISFSRNRKRSAQAVGGCLRDQPLHYEMFSILEASTEQSPPPGGPQRAPPSPPTPWSGLTRDFSWRTGETGTNQALPFTSLSTHGHPTRMPSPFPPAGDLLLQVPSPSRIPRGDLPLSELSKQRRARFEVQEAAGSGEWSVLFLARTISEFPENAKPISPPAPTTRP